jgi:hypothetical protein
MYTSTSLKGKQYLANIGGYVYFYYLRVIHINELCPI